MEFDWINGGALTLAGGAIAWAFRTITQAKKDRTEREDSRARSDLALTQHQDGLTFELLRAAHAHAAAMRTELDRVTEELGGMRTLRWRIDYFEEAIEHVEQLILARAEGRSEAAEDSARKFLARVTAMNSASGLAANREQAARAAAKLEDKSE